MFCPNLKITKTSFGFYGQLLSSVSLSELARKADEIGNTLLEYVFSVQIPVLYTVGLYVIFENKVLAVWAVRAARENDF